MARRRAVLCILAIIIAQIVARPALGQAAQWANLATVSNSTSLQAGSLCATDGRDIYCNNSVATLSELAQADRITSGTTGVYVSNTGTIMSYVSGLPVGVITSNGNVVGFGLNAANRNTGNKLISIGDYAAQLNSGSVVVAVGSYAGQLNSGSFVIGIGNSSSRGNTGNHVIGIGNSAAYMNSGTYVTSLGSNAARLNTGSRVVALGYQAGYQNSYANVVLLGDDTRADKANQVVLGGTGTVEVTTTGVILAAGVSTTGTVSATDIKLARNATLPAAKCASAADEGRIVMTGDGPYICTLR